MGWKVALGLLTCLALAASSPAPAAHVLHEKRGLLPSRWTRLGRAHGVLPMRIGLAQTNLENAQEYLMDLSHPSSPKYGKHWTAEQVTSAFKPTDETVEKVRQWVANAGIHGVALSDNKAWLAFHATVEQAESLLHTEYFDYEDEQTGGVMPACEQYHLPRQIQKHIDYITPGIKLLAPSERPVTEEKLSKRQHPQQRRHRGRVHGPSPKQYFPSEAVRVAAANDLTTCDTVITPACVAALYQIPPGQLAHPNNSLGIFESELQFWDQEDLTLFFANFTSIPNGTHPINYNVDGGRAQTNYTDEGGVEAMLDLELAYPIVYPQSITVWDVDDLNYQNMPNDTYTWGFNTLLDAMDGSYCNYSAYGETGNLAGVDPEYPDDGFLGYNGSLQCGVFMPTNVISISYGGQEADVPVSYQKRQCNEFLKLGLQGVTFVFASGDAGVGNYPAPKGDDGPTGCLGPKGDIFNPTWPNTCPWITNVGATKVYPGRTVNEPESAAFDPAGGHYPNNYSSGGGFSNIYPIPEYQQTAVSTFFADHEPSYPSYSALAANVTNPYLLANISSLAGSTGGIYNRIGRGVPDVAANGDNIAVYSAGRFSLNAGTSASTPIFAGIINRINEERIAVGKGPVGFVNPTLYAHPEVLNDITNGTNPGCGTSGFSAVKGWDPVTGLGTPNYPKMLKLFMSLP